MAQSTDMNLLNPSCVSGSKDTALSMSPELCSQRQAWRDSGSPSKLRSATILNGPVKGVTMGSREEGH